MNKLIILGNGFDLAHGMRTKYSDFIDWVVLNQIKKIQSSILDNSVNLRVQKLSISGEFFNIVIYKGDYLLNSDESEILELCEFYINTKDSLFGYLLNSKRLSNVSFSIDHMKKDTINTIFSELIKQYNSLSMNWSSIEDIYYKLLIEHISKPVSQVKKLNEDLNKIKQYLKVFLNEKLEDNSIDVDEYFKYEDEYISELDVESKKDGYQCLLNFNYTKTYYPYLKNLISNRFEEVIDIHNTLKDKNIVFGYGDEIDERYKSLEGLNQNDFLENVKSVAYLENNNYSRLLNFIDDDYFYVFIMGHSCGLSDKTLLNTIFEHKNCVFVKLFYYQFRDGDGKIVGDNFKELSVNISRHFSDKKILRKKVLSKDKCVPLPQWDD